MKFALQNLRNALQIAMCEALIRTLYFYRLQKKRTRKIISNVYDTFSFKISLILYNNWDRIIFKITVSCSPNLIVILCSHLWKVLCPQSVLFLEEVK